MTVSLKGGKKVTALIGNKKGEDEYYVKTPEAPQVFIVKKYNADRVIKRPIEFRDKTICDIADTDVSEIAVSRGDNSYTISKSGSDWKASKPAKLDVDPAKVSLRGGVQGMEGAELRGGRRRRRPTAWRSLRRRSPRRARAAPPACVKVGDETKDKLNYYVDERQEQPDVFLAPKWNVDRVLVKIDDLKKAAARGSAPVAAGRTRTSNQRDRQTR